MFIEKLVKNNFAEFPGFDLVGYCEFSIPMFKRELHCSMVSKKRLPVVDEFVLRYSTLDIPLNEISKIMGLTYELIEQAWFNLLSYELIDRLNDLTEKGKEYLNLFRMDNFEILEANVAINGLTGDIELDNSNMISGKALREAGLKSVKPLIETPNISNIDMRKLKQAIMKIKRNRDGNDENKLVGLNHVVDKATNYKRLFLLVFADQEKNNRFMVFDGWQRMMKYEDCLLNLESIGSQIIKVNMGNFFSGGYKPRLLDTMTSISKEQTMMNISQISEEWDLAIKNAKKNILVSLPLVDLSDPTDNLINELEMNADKGLKIEIYVTGREFTNSYQKRQYERLLNKANIKVVNYPYYDSRILLVDNTVAIISDYKKTELNLPISKESYAEFGYKIDDINRVLGVTKWTENYNVERMAIPIGVSKEWVNKKLLNIVNLYYQFDEKLKKINNVGWLQDEALPDTQKLLDSVLVTNEAQYKEVLNTMNKSLVESVESVWSKNGLKNFFWDKFKNEFPELQKVLHKIRLYRHSVHHLSLEERFKVTYYRFLDEDLEGAMPMFVKNGYQRVQIKLIESLETELIKLIT